MLDGENALILDIGIGGAFFEHYGRMTLGARRKLLFRWEGSDVEFVCRVTRTAVVRTAGTNDVSHTGVRFIDAVGDSEARLHEMMATFVGTVLAAQRSNARGILPASGAMPLAQLGAARRIRSRGYVVYRWHDGAWTIRATNDSKQPPDGFTVAAYEDEEELETLCRTYELADDEGRRLIRLVAELSVRTEIREG